MPANQLQVNGTTYDINDSRLISSTAAVSDANWKTAQENEYTAANGDIYVRKVGYTRASTSGNWSYVINPDGTAYCWFAKSFSPSWGSWYNLRAHDNPLTAAERTYPVTFLENPVVITSCAGGFSGWQIAPHTSGNEGSTTKCPNFCAITMASGGSYTVRIMAIGKVAV